MVYSVLLISNLSDYDPGVWACKFLGNVIGLKGRARRSFERMCWGNILDSESKWHKKVFKCYFLINEDT